MNNKEQLTNKIYYLYQLADLYRGGEDFLIEEGINKEDLYEEIKTKFNCIKDTLPFKKKWGDMTFKEYIEEALQQCNEDQLFYSFHHVVCNLDKPEVQQNEEFGELKNEIEIWVSVHKKLLKKKREDENL